MQKDIPLIKALIIVNQKIFPSLLSNANIITAVREYLQEHPEHNDIALEIMNLATVVFKNKRDDYTL